MEPLPLLQQSEPAVEDGDIAVQRMTVKENERLDIIAGRVYGNSGLWWVIAAASGIGWSPQVPAGTIVFIPINLSDISRIVG